MGRRPREDDEFGFSPRFAEALGRTIKVLRTDQGLERRELAQRAHISYSYLTEIENGNKPPSSAVLRDIASALGFSMSSLIEAAEVRLETQRPPSVPVASAEGWALRFGDRRTPDREAPPERDVLARATQDERETIFRDALTAPQRDELLALSQDELPAPRRGRRPALMRDAYEPPGARRYAQLDLHQLRSSCSGPDLRAVLIEFERLLRTMDPEDIERLLDYARRLAR